MALRQQYDVSNPFQPKLTGLVRIGGIVVRAPHPADGGALNGGPQMVADGGNAFDPSFFVRWPKPHRPHQVRLEGGDCPSDSYCYP